MIGGVPASVSWPPVNGGAPPDVSRLPVKGGAPAGASAACSGEISVLQNLLIAVLIQLREMLRVVCRLVREETAAIAAAACPSAACRRLLTVLAIREEEAPSSSTKSNLRHKLNFDQHDAFYGVVVLLHDQALALARPGHLPGPPIG